VNNSFYNDPLKTGENFTGKTAG